MARVDNLLVAGLKTLGTKPPDGATRQVKQNYSQRASEVVALAFAEELRERGLKTARPAPPGVVGASGAERRMAGGIGPKRVDVSWATEESGLLLAISVKTINFRDNRSQNFQKNLVNRRSDMLYESVTLHRRFPFAVLTGFLIFDHQAANDATATRRSTFENAHSRLRLFAGRDDPAGRDEQYETLYVCLMDANQFSPVFDTYAVGDPTTPIPLASAFDELIGFVATRNPDFYETVGSDLKPVR
jgi:hypothetical protein